MQGVGKIGPFRDGEFCGTRGESRAIEAIYVQLTRVRPDRGQEGRGRVALDVQVHVQGLGDQVFQQDEWAGIKGQGKRMEGFEIRIKEPVRGLGLRYMAHVENVGDTEWAYSDCSKQPGSSPDCAFVGTRDKGLRVEGFAIECTGPAAGAYRVVYWAHVQDLGDIGPFRNGQYCGTRGQARRVEAIKVRLVRKPVTQEEKAPPKSPPRKPRPPGRNEGEEGRG